MMRMVMMIVTVGKQSGVLLSVNINTQQSRLVAFVSLSKLSFHFSKFYNLVKEIDTVNPISLKSYILHSFPNWLKTNVSSYQNAHSSETVNEKDLSHKSTNAFLILDSCKIPPTMKVLEISRAECFRQKASLSYCERQNQDKLLLYIRGK